MVVEKSFLSIKLIVKFYQDDLKGNNDFTEAEFELWLTKWKSVVAEVRQNTITETFKNYEKSMFSNMYKLLKLLAILPLSTATAERYFSILWRPKTYLKNSTSESRLVGLSLLAIHRSTDVTDETVLYKFSRNGNVRKP